MKQQKTETEFFNVMAQDAVRIASGWLLERLPDRFGPADPTLDERNTLWRVPVVLAYPGMVVGEVGEILIDAQSCEIVFHTDIEEMKTLGLELGRKHRAKVRAAFLQTRDT
ncbi:MAG: hypothetical protein ACREEM_53425 [Blastocatellia bacterium]